MTILALVVLRAERLKEKGYAVIVANKYCCHHDILRTSCMLVAGLLALCTGVSKEGRG